MVDIHIQSNLLVLTFNLLTLVSPRRKKMKEKKKKGECSFNQSKNEISKKEELNDRSEEVFP